MPKATGREIAEQNKFEFLAPESDEIRIPEIQLELTREQVGELDIGKRAEITIIGNVKSIRQGENDNGVSIEVQELAVVGGSSNVFESMAADDPEDRGI